MAKPNLLRDAEALAYRAHGWTFERIANEMGYCDKSAARKAVERAIQHSAFETEREAKTILLADLNAAKQAAWAVLETNHITISHGQVVRVDGAPIPDDGPVLEAIDRIIKIDQEMAKIYGVYAPTKSVAEVRTATELDAEIERLMAELGQRGETATPQPSQD